MSGIHWAPFSAVSMRTQSAMESKGYGKTYLQHHPEAQPGVVTDETAYIRNNDMMDALYAALKDLTTTLSVGDTFEFPDGTTCKVEWKMPRSNG